jgi:rubrerythrin
MAQTSPLEYAIQLERDGQAFYGDAAAKTRNPLGKKMFESLAADERRHEAVLRAVAAEQGVSLEGAMPKERIVTLFAELGAAIRAQLGAEPDDNAVLEEALGMERASVELYAGQAGKAGGSEEKALYERLAAEERQHVEILQSTLAYLNDTGHWFLWDEQAILDGG